MSPIPEGDFQTAVEKTIDELKALQDKFAASLPESESLIFTAHFMMLKDKNFTGKMKTLIEQGQLSCGSHPAGRPEIHQGFLG